MEKLQNTSTDFLISHIEMDAIKWVFYDGKWSVEPPGSALKRHVMSCMEFSFKTEQAEEALEALHLI